MLNLQPFEQIVRMLINFRTLQLKTNMHVQNGGKIWILWYGRILQLLDFLPEQYQQVTFFFQMPWNGINIRLKEAKGLIAWQHLWKYVYVQMFSWLAVCPRLPVKFYITVFGMEEHCMTRCPVRSQYKHTQ